MNATEAVNRSLTARLRAAAEILSVLIWEQKLLEKQMHCPQQRKLQRRLKPELTHTNFSASLRGGEAWYITQLINRLIEIHHKVNSSGNSSILIITQIYPFKITRNQLVLQLSINFKGNNWKMLYFTTPYLAVGKRCISFCRTWDKN
jgi:hypothetical protein